VADVISESLVRGEVGFSYNLRSSPDAPMRWTILLRHQECLLGIWNFSRLGMSKEGFEEMSEEEFDLWCTIIVLRLSCGDLTCP